MARDVGYFPLRNWFAYNAWLILGHAPFDGPVPNDLPQDQARVARYLKTLEERDNTGADMENRPDG